MKIKENKSLGIFYIGNRKIVVSDDILFLLNGISCCIDDLIILYAKETALPQIEKLKKKITLTFGTVQIYTCKEISYANKIADTFNYYDLVCIFDDSFYGPIYDFNDVFTEMNLKNIDYWGITSQYNGQLGCMLPQSYFIVYNSEIVKARIFKDIFIKSNKNYYVLDNILNEISKLNYKWEVYASTGLYDGQTFSYLETLGLFKNPFILKKKFTSINLSEGACEEPAQLLNFIQEKTDYDIRMIWENLLIEDNIADLKKTLHLEYILSDQYCLEPDSTLQHKNIAVIIHLYYDDLIKFCFNYIAKISESVDVFITAADNQTIQLIEKEIVNNNLLNCTIIKKQNRGRDISAFFVTCKEIIRNYEFVCCVHDKKNQMYSSPLDGTSWLFDLWENTIKNQIYIDNIINCFLKNHKLGLLVPPQPYFGNYISTMDMEWTRSFANTKTLAEIINLNCNIDINKPPFTMGTTFWARTAALSPLLEYGFNYEDFPEEPLANDGTISHAIEKILGYVAQSQGYYTGVVQNEAYASLRINGLEILLKDALSELRKAAPIYNVRDIKDCMIRSKKIIKFCNDFKTVYIYGAGTFGRQAYEILEKNDVICNGFLVSDGHRKEKEYCNLPVYELAEIQDINVGIIIAVSKSDNRQMDVIRVLEGRGMNSYITIV